VNKIWQPLKEGTGERGEDMWTRTVEGEEWLCKEKLISELSS